MKAFISVFIFALSAVTASCSDMISDASAKDAVVGTAEGDSRLFCVSGTIEDKWGECVRSARIEGRGVSMEAECAPDGSYVFENIPAGSYVVKALSDGISFYPESVRADVSSGDVCGVKFKTFRDLWDVNFTEQYRGRINSVICDGDFICAAGSRVNGVRAKDAFVAKLDANCDVVWQKNFGDKYDDEAVKICPSGGAYYVLYNSVVYDDVRGGSNIRLARISSDGDVIFDVLYGSTSFEAASDMLVLEDESVLVLGSLCREGTGSDVVLIRFSKNGDVLSSSVYGGAGDEYASALASDGKNIYACAYRGRCGTDNIFLLKYDAGFCAVGFAEIESPLNEYPTGMVCVDGAFYLCGYEALPATLKSNALFYSLASDGSVLIRRVYGNDGNDEFRSILSCGAGFVICGKFASERQIRDLDFLVMIADSAGETVREKRYGGMSDEEAVAVAAKSKGGFVIGGSFGSPDERWKLISTDMLLGAGE